MCCATDVSGGRISRPASHRVHKTPIRVSRVRWEGEEEGGDKREVAPRRRGGSERGCGRRGRAGAVSAFSTCEDVDLQCRSASCAVAVRLGHVTLTTALTRQPHSLNLRQLPRPKADSRHFAPGTEEPGAVSPTSEPATTTPNDTSDQMDFAGVQRTCHPDATEPRGHSPGRGTCEATEQALGRLGLKSYPALLSITVQHGSCG